MTFVTGNDPLRNLHLPYTQGVSHHDPQQNVMNKIHLLIVEEHAAVRSALEIRLRATPTVETVAAVNTLDAGLQYARKYHPDVVLLGCKGSRSETLFLLVEAVKDMVKGKAAVIIFAPYADEMERETLLQAGASRYLLKTINTPQLISEIETAVRKNQPPKQRFSEYAVFQTHLLGLDGV